MSLLHDQILAPLLGIGDVRTDKRIDFVGGARGTAALERAVGSGAAAVAFSMYPVNVADLMAISDAGEIMPPKSTWFEPKLRDGLLIHHLMTLNHETRRPDADWSRAVTLQVRLLVWPESVSTTMVVADAFEQSGIDGLKAAGCEVVHDPRSTDEALAAALRRDPRRRARRPVDQGHRARCWTPARWR